MSKSKVKRIDKKISPEAKSWKLNMRWISLTCLSLQTTTIITVYSYSRNSSGGAIKYLSSTVVVIAELFKFLICLLVIFKDSGFSKTKFLSTLHREVIFNFRESVKVSVPAALYAIQNNLAFYALNNLDPATFQVSYQLRILTTALFSVLLVNKKLSKKQYVSLFLLFIGVSLVQIPKADVTNKTNNGEKNFFLGMLSVLACCLSSGFSGVYFERLVKSNRAKSQSLWMRNLQLAFLCLAISTVVMLQQDYRSIKEGGLLQGYTNTTWIVVFLQAFGGLVVATVVKYSDNVLKGFATSISIILSTVLSYFILDNFNLSTHFFYGASIVIVSTVMYNS